MFEGSWVALATPFKDGEVDEKRLQELVEFQIDGGTTGLVPCGTTGESPTLSHKEHGRVIELVVRFAKKRLPVLAGAGSNSTSEAVQLTRHAKAVGADGVLSVVPYYNKPTQKGMTDHFRTVAREGLPVVVYNIPGRTGVNMLPETLIALARAEKNVVGVKESSGNLDQSSEVAAALGPGFSLLSGDDSLTLPILSVGGKGVISVLANIAPKDVAALCRAWKDGDVQKAQALHLKMFPLVKALFLESNPVPLKTAMGWLDLCSPEMRPPLAPMDKANQEKLEKALRAYGLLGAKRAHAAC